MSERETLAAKLREQLADLRTREAEAVASGDQEQITALRERIAAVEAVIGMLIARVDNLMTQGWRFTLERDPESDLLIEIIATPLA